MGRSAAALEIRQAIFAGAEDWRQSLRPEEGGEGRSIVNQIKDLTRGR